MKNWTEIQIGIVYFTGLFIALLGGILCLWYLRPIKKPIKKITSKFRLIWNRSFKTTVILAGLLGAMSVTFRDCEGNYDYLLESRTKTIMKGIEQVSVSCDYLAVILGVWFVILITLLLTLNKKKDILNT